ncbi:MAG: sugar ABC transporter substrate-binding protein [Butyricicoccaceae bacterium]
MKMRRFAAFALAASMATSLLAGCGGSSESGSGSTSEDTIKIEVILNTLASEYWGYVQAGAEAYGAEHDNVEVSVVGPPSETSYDEQGNMIETALGSGEYDGLVISALQPDMVATKISGTEIPIIAVNTPLEAPEVLGFVGTGNEAAAAEGGKAAVEAAKEAGWTEIKAIEIAGPQGDVTVEERYSGFKRGVEEAGGEFLENEVQYADSLADKAVDSMEAIMQRYPEGIAVIVCHNDDMAIAAAEAAKNNKAYENTIFCGFDGIQSACEAIIEGSETMSVAQDAYGMGYKAVENCVAAINGEQVEEFTDTGCEIITADTAQDRLDTLKSYLGN